MSLRLMPTSSTPWGVNISRLGKDCSSTSTSTVRASSLPARSCSRSFSRVSVMRSGSPPPSPGARLGPAGAARRAPNRHRIAARAEAGGGRRRGQQQLQQALLGALPGPFAHRLALLLPHHGDADLHEVADHRLDVAPHVAHLGELARLDLDEGGARELGEAAGDLGLADARGADHEDVLRVDLLAPSPPAAAGAASGCARRWRPPSSPRAGPPRSGRARPRSGAA